MTEFEGEGLGAHWRELRRHPAFQTAAVYVGASWALIEAADIFFPAMSVGTLRWLGAILATGFPLVVGATWWFTREKAARAGQTAGAEEAARTGEASGAGSRRRRYAYATAVALLLLGGIFWWASPRLLTGSVAPEAEVIAVLPFNTSGAGVELLGEGMVDLLSTNLDAVGGIRTVDSRTVLHRWRQRAVDGSLDLEGALEVGRGVDAGSILLGSAVAAGPEVRLSAQLYSLAGSELARAGAEGPADSVLALVDSLSLNLLRAVWRSREPIPNLRVSAITTGSVDAIRAYLRGERHYRHSRWDSAKAAFGEAVGEDSTFALAHYRLALTYGWSDGFGSRGARRHGEIALAYAERVPPRERGVLVAHQLFEEGKAAALDTLGRHVKRYPDDPEGWYLLGDVRFHARPLLDGTLEDYYGPFDRTLQLDSSLVPAIIHPLELSLLFNDSAAYRRYLRAMRAAGPSAELDAYERADRVLWGPPDSVMPTLTRLQELDSRLVGTVTVAALRGGAIDPDTLLTLLRRTSGGFPFGGTSRTNLLSSRALMMTSLGRLTDARAPFDTLWTLDPQGQGALMSYPVIAGLVDSAYAAPVFELLRQTAPSPALEQVFDYWRMVYALTRGRIATARRLAERGLAADSSFARDEFAGLVEAGLGWSDLLAGDTVGGVARMKAGLRTAGFQNQALQLGGPLRFELALTLAARPETRAEGIRRLRYGWWTGDVVYFAPGYLALGRALEAAGDAAGAARAYSHFVRLWDDADAHLQPQVETARRALERLAGEGAM